MEGKKGGCPYAKTEMRMGKWMCGASFDDKPGGVTILNKELCSRM